jgi:hypothetical protein
VRGEERLDDVLLRTTAVAEVIPLDADEFTAVYE